MWHQDYLLIKYVEEMALAASLWVSPALPTPSTSTTLSPGLTAASLNLVSAGSNKLRLGGRIGASSKGAVCEPVILKEQQVSPITQFKYLGKILDNKHTFKINADCNEFKRKPGHLFFLLGISRSFNTTKNDVQDVFSVFLTLFSGM